MYLVKKGFGLLCLLWGISVDCSASDVRQNDIRADNKSVSVKSAQNVDLKEVVVAPFESSDPVQQPISSPAAEADEPLIKTNQKVENATPPSIPSVESADSAPFVPVIVNSDPKTVDGKGSPPAHEPEPSIEERLENSTKRTSDVAVSKSSLVLLKNEVLPGTTTRLSWSPSVSFMGISAPTAVLVLNGIKDGPTVCLTAAVHGDELNGIEIVRRVLYNIDPQKLTGSIIGVPIVNLHGFRSGSRYLSDRRDLNRFFPGDPEGSSASRIAYSFFHEVVSHCDMLIDLHTGSFRRTNLPQLRADLSYPKVARLSRKMGAIVVVQSKGAEGSLRRAATENGIPAVTLEAGAPHELKKSAVEYGVKSVESALDGLGLINRRNFWERTSEPVYYKSTWVRSREGGILLSEVRLGQNVKQEDLLGAVTDPITNLRHEIRSPYTGRVIGMALNQVMHPGYAAYHIGIKASVIEAIGAPVSERVDAEPFDRVMPTDILSSALLDSGDNDENPEEDGEMGSLLSEPNEESDE